MKTRLLFLFVLLTVGACKKGENDIEPQSAAEAVAGTYTLTSFRYSEGADQINLPKLPLTQNGSTVSGTVELNKTSSDDEVDFKLTLKITGQDDAEIEIDGVEVKKTSEAYGLIIDGNQVADVDGSNIIFNLSETAQSGEKLELAFVGKK